MGETYWAVFDPAGFLHSTQLYETRRDITSRPWLHNSRVYGWPMMRKFGYRCRKVKVTPHE